MTADSTADLISSEFATIKAALVAFSMTHPDPDALLRAFDATAKATSAVCLKDGVAANVIQSSLFRMRSMLAGSSGMKPESPASKA